MANKIKVFVSLPITGRINEARKEAEEVKRLLTDVGYEVVTPFEVAPKANQPESYYMGRCVEALMGCDFICQKPDACIRSRGCHIEWHIATMYEIPFVGWPGDNANKEVRQ